MRDEGRDERKMKIFVNTTLLQTFLEEKNLCEYLVLTDMFGNSIPVYFGRDGTRWSKGY